MKYDNVSKTLAPGYLKFGAGSGNALIGGGGDDEAYDPHIYINAGEDIKKGQVVQVAQATAIEEENEETTEDNKKVMVCFIQNSQRNDHNETIGIAVENCQAGDDCKIQRYGVFDYNEILEEKELPVFDGKQLFCINNVKNNNTKNINVSDKPNFDDNHIIKIGKLITSTKVLIQIEEFVN